MQHLVIFNQDLLMSFKSATLNYFVKNFGKLKFKIMKFSKLSKLICLRTRKSSLFHNISCFIFVTVIIKMFRNFSAQDIFMNFLDYQTAADNGKISNSFFLCYAVILLATCVSNRRNENIPGSNRFSLSKRISSKYFLAKLITN